MKIILIGGGGHAKVVLDILLSLGPSGHEIVGYLDDAAEPELRACRHLGRIDRLPDWFGPETRLVCAIGNNRTRQAIVDSVNARILPAMVSASPSDDGAWGTFIHPTACVSPFARLGAGTVVMPHAVVNADAEVGAHCILNTGSIVEHDCRVDAFSHVSPNATLCGKVKVGHTTHIGAGATVLPGVAVGSRCIVGAGAVVVRSVPDNQRVKGVPAR